MLRKYALSIYFLFVKLTAFSEVALTDTLHRTLDAVNIIASGSEKENGQTPRSVTVLTRADLEQAPYITLSDLLQEQTGIYIVGSGQAPGSNQSLFLRGSNSNQSAVFIDGVRIQDVSTINGVADLSELPLADVERVEILRGAQGTLYGSPACGGVIRISTRPAAQSAGYHGNFGMRGGLYKVGGKDAGVNGRLSYKSEKGWHISTSHEYFTSSGFDATTDTGELTPETKPDVDPWEKSLTTFATGYSSSSTTFNLSYRNLQQQTAIDAAAYKDEDNYTLDYNRHLLSAEFSNLLKEHWRFSGNAGWTATKRLALNDSSLSTETGLSDGTWSKDLYDGRQFTTDLLLNYQPDETISITGGIALLTESMDQQNEYISPFFSYSSSLDSLNPSAANYAIFLHSDLSGLVLHPSLGRLNFLLGARANRHSICGTGYSFEFSPSYMIGSTSLLYASFSSGYTNPSLYQLFAPDQYVPWDGQAPAGLTRGNSALVPETTLSGELGVKGKAGARLDWEVSVFRSITRNMIDYVYLWDGTVPVNSLVADPMRDDFRGDRYINVGEQHAYGIEAGVSVRINERLSLSMNGCLLDGYQLVLPKDTIPYITFQSFATGIFLTEETRYDGLLRRPSGINLRVDYIPVEPLHLRLQVRHTGSRPDVYYDSALGPYGALNRKAVAAYTLADFSASCKLKHGILLNLRIENILNTDYQEIFGFQTRGRGIQLGASVSL
jgi:vitamin B12 transporter